MRQNAGSQNVRIVVPKYDIRAMLSYYKRRASVVATLWHTPLADSVGGIPLERQRVPMRGPRIDATGGGYAIAHFADPPLGLRGTACHSSTSM